MAWCIQCGSAGTPEPAIGVDEDGEAACAMHRVRPAKFEVATVAPSPQPAIQKRAEAVMKTVELKPCPGYEKACDQQIRIAKELCTRCYARRFYAQTHPKKTKPLSSLGRKAKEPKKSAVELKAELGGGAVDLAALKAKLQAELAAIEVVERLMVLGIH